MFHSKKRGSSSSPYLMQKAVTLGGAQQLGRRELGSLEPGKAADLFIIDVEKFELAGAVLDPVNLLP